VQPFDAVLLIAFGGPGGRDDVRPFLANVLRGRRVSPERVEDVVHHYDLFDGISPITELTRRQASSLEARLDERGLHLPVYVGMRNWHPYLADTLRRMSADGVTRAIGVIAAAHRSYSSCTQYRENVLDARRRLRAAEAADVEITYVCDWHLTDGFIEANAAHIRTALESLPADVRDQAEILFTAHSIPLSMAQRYPYERQIRESAQAVIELLGRGDWYIVYQSRSGRPEDPWLEPDVCDYLRETVRRGTRAAVLCPIGFVSDHIEVLYDLDIEAANVARVLGLPLARASAVNDHPGFVSALANAVEETIAQYATGRPLQIGAPA
jgi:protoporphyrin/coproporphyrin ferrochelatase